MSKTQTKPDYTNPKQRPETMKRESPQDLVLDYNRWQKQNPERRLTIKGFVIVREQERKAGDK